MKKGKVLIPAVKADVLRNLRLLEGHHPGTMQEFTRKRRKQKSKRRK